MSRIIGGWVDTFLLRSDGAVMDRDNFIASLNSVNPARFVETHLFDRIPSVFGADRELYVTWKRRLGELLEVDPASISLVGSAATGISLNPDKHFKTFDEASDVDVAVISHYHFTVAWRFLRLNGARRHSLDDKTRRAWDEHVQKYIYWGTIATDRLLGVLPFGHVWLKATSEMGRREPTSGRSVNLRIYADYDSLRAYQVKSVRSARNSTQE